MDIKALYNIYKKFPKVVTDTRKLEPNSLFFALKGGNFDGNQFAKKALEGGCEYAVIDNPDFEEGERYLLVDDVLKTLQNLATFHRSTLDIPIIAITGTNGKTTTKELVAGVLAQKYNLGFTQGNLNNHIGVPLTLLSFTEETEVGVVEMGANHVGEIAQLCEIAEPNYGLITNVGSAHLEGFGSFEGVKQAKGELYDWLFDNGGLVFINSDNEHLLGMLHPQRNFTYGTSNLAECSGELLPAKGFFLRAQAILHIDDEKTVELVELNTQILGNYNFENVMAAAAIGMYFGIKAPAIKESIETYRPENNRSQLIESSRNIILLDAYNANPTSMRAAIDNLSALEIENKAVILGDMLELGEVSYQEHQSIISLLQEKGIAKAYLVGPVFSQLDSDFKTFGSAGELAEHLKKEPIEKSNILIKGSRGIGLEKLVECLT